jgi:hypothetical protein
LYAEGETDREYFQPLLVRALTDIVLTRGTDSVEVQESFIRLPDNKKIYNNREDRIFHGVAAAIDAVSFLFIHADGNGDPLAASQNRIIPAQNRIRASYPNLGTVGVVPERETEAWALADGEVVAQALGVNRLNEKLRGVEKMIDPKAKLRALADQYRQYDVRGVLNIIGQRTRLSELRKLRSYREFEANLIQELKRLNLII